MSQLEYDNMNALTKRRYNSYTNKADQFTFLTESSIEFKNLIEEYDRFVAAEAEKNTIFKFWNSYIKMVQHLLHFVRAAQQGNWDLHLSSIRYMLPWMFACNQTNYSRYLPAYYLEMVDLPNTHPAVHQVFLNGEFVVQRQDSHGIAQIPSHQTIESTFNNTLCATALPFQAYHSNRADLTHNLNKKKIFVSRPPPALFWHPASIFFQKI